MFPVNDPATVAAVTAVFHAYESALVTNDVPALRTFFWDSAAAVRFGTDEQLYGIEEISTFRQNRVIDISNHQGVRTTITTFGSSVATMYEYVATIDGQEGPGRQSQSWICFDGVWKIVAAHVSRASSTSPASPDWPTFLQQATAIQNLDIDPASRAGVIMHLRTIAGLAAPLLAFELPLHTEPAPVFVP
ncbi:MAG: DUF3225 domain-containing protein [Candidatus Synoicihabitans palmerolidicus]|nr:DUF3225 domain-containing protein [Candidatus Synoicihabitans palmerolidicus]